jgi:peptidoglycan/xylan/chitin deacetylase (PgdA/CDA1 family)
MNRRDFLKITGAAGTVACGLAPLVRAVDAKTKPAQVAITLDLEMARNFPTWDETRWDYEKGNLNDEMKAYALEAAKRVKAAGGVVHFFLVARALEQENVEWLKTLIKEGHRIGSHTYDHVFLLAKTADEIQYRFKRCPWLIAGKKPLDVIRENVALATAAMKSRLGIEPAGIRAPGGFADGLKDRQDVQKMLLEQGFKWISAKYPAHKLTEPGKKPTQEHFDDIVRAQQTSQPFRYSTGLLEIPMSPASDIVSFRAQRWNRENFLRAIRAGLGWCIEHGAMYDFLSHPACLYVTDPKFEAIDLICDMVKQSKNRVTFADLETVARTASV